MSEFERYNPINPLPEEIQKLPSDETVCKFCGVSYLIHNEIKKLEEKLQATLKQLEDYNRMKNQFESLESKNAEYVENAVKYDNQLTYLNETVVKLEEDLKKKEEEIESLRGENCNLKQTCQSQADRLKNDSEKIQNFTKLTSFYPPLLKQIRILKESRNQSIADFQSLKDFHQRELQSLSVYVNEITKKSAFDAEKVAKLSADNRDLTNRVSQHTTENTKLLDQIRILERSSSSLSHTQEQNVQLSKLVAETQREVELLKDKLLKCEDDRVNLEQTAKSKTEENNELKSHLNSQTKRYTKQIEDLNNKYNSSLEIQNSLKHKISSHVQEYEKEKEKESSRHVNLEVHNTELMKKVELLSGEMKCIQDKNRTMSETHRIQLAELHVSYQQQLKDALKESTDYKSQMERLQSELSQQKSQLRDAIHDTSGKYEREIQQMTKQNTEAHLNLEKQIETLSQQYSCDLKSKEAAIKEIEKSFSLQSAGLKREKEALARNISHLTEQISVYERRVKQLECAPPPTPPPQVDSEQLTKLKNRNTELEGEVLTLQRIVQRECEERYELQGKIEELQAVRESREMSDVSSRSSTNTRSNTNILKGRPKVEKSLSRGQGVSRRGAGNRLRRF